MHEAGSSSEFGTDFDTHVGAGSAAPSGPGPDAARSAHLGAHVEAERGAECDADGGPDAGTASGPDAGPAGGSDAGSDGGPDAGSDGGPDSDAGAGHGIDYGVVHRAKSGAVLRPMPAAPSPVVPAQRGVRDAARGEVLLRHARLASSGRPVFCTPSRAELAGVVSPRAGRGTDGKVIYPTREAAEAAARELEALGARSLRAYRCSRSRRGHFHLTTDSTPRSHLPLHLRIPQQRLSA